MAFIPEGCTHIQVLRFMKVEGDRIQFLNVYGRWQNWTKSPRKDWVKRSQLAIGLNDAVLADLRLAAETLRRYEVLHRAKNTDDSLAKAEANAALASRFEATIAAATGAS